MAPVRSLPVHLEYRIVRNAAVYASLLDLAKSSRNANPVKPRATHDSVQITGAASLPRSVRARAGDERGFRSLVIGLTATRPVASRSGHVREAVQACRSVIPPY